MSSPYKSRLITIIPNQQLTPANHRHNKNHTDFLVKMSNHTYLPLSWPPIRRDGPEQSKTDKAITIAIVCGISALFLVPLVWYTVARIITVHRERAKTRAVDIEQGV